MSDTLAIHSAEDLQEEFQCPVCLKVPRSTPIYQCPQGHIHCKSCHPQLSRCPICRSEIGNIRNLILEKIIARLPRQCNFHEYGCLVENQLPQDIIEHEEKCHFRTMNCLVKFCLHTYPICDAVQHFRTNHPEVNLEKKSTICFQVDLDDPEDQENSWLPRYLSCDDKDFLCKVTTNATNQGRPYLDQQTNDFYNLFSLQVILLGSKEDIYKHEFDCMVKAYKKGKKGCLDFEDIEITSKVPVAIIGDHHASASASLILSPEQLEHLSDDEEDEGNVVNFEVTITSHTNILKENLIVRNVDTVATNFIEACYYGGEKTLEETLKKYSKNKTFNINTQIKNGLNGFMIVCMKGYVNMAALFLKYAKECDFDLNATDKRGGTALFSASSGEQSAHVDIVRLMSQHPSDIEFNLADSHKTTPFMMASQNTTEHATEMLELFIEIAKPTHNINYNAIDEDGDTAFHYAAESGNEDIIRLLIQSAELLKIDLDHENNDGETGYDKMSETIRARICSKKPRLK